MMRADCLNGWSTATDSLLLQTDSLRPLRWRWWCRRERRVRRQVAYPFFIPFLSVSFVRFFFFFLRAREYPPSSSPLLSTSASTARAFERRRGPSWPRGRRRVCRSLKSPGWSSATPSYYNIILLLLYAFGQCRSSQDSTGGGDKSCSGFFFFIYNKFIK